MLRSCSVDVNMADSKPPKDAPKLARLGHKKRRHSLTPSPDSKSVTLGSSTGVSYFLGEQLESPFRIFSSL